MPIALVVEDGTARSDSTAYVSRSDADTYFNLHAEPADWVSTSPEDKDIAIRMATQYLDVVYVGRWEGRRVKQAQALAWPRYGVTDDTGWAVLSSAVPQQVKDACCEAAIRHIKLSSSGGLLPDIDAPGTIQSERVSIGGAIQEEIVYSSPKSQIPRFRIIDGLLADFISPEAAATVWRG